jgi:hypothetical protein
MTLLDSVDLGNFPAQTTTCPACGTAVAQPFYGPCPDCRAGMRERLAGEAREVETTEYVPKMNVTPNAVALKDD